MTQAQPSSPANNEQADPAFVADVLSCFRDTRRAIPARWLYDQAGSELFEKITELNEYYPTRTETALLKQYCPILADKGAKGRAVVEFGSGSSVKTPHLLSAIAPSHYVPIDISGDFLRASADILRQQFPDLPILPVEGDFMQDLQLPDAVKQEAKIGFFPGSTIGNMVARTSVNLLRSMRKILGENALLLIGMDRIKSPDILIPAYDDAEGVTAEFNLNLLRRINREMQGDIPVEAFHHEARWNDDFARIEMHFVADKAVEFSIMGERFTMAKGETIHTENSHKYGERDGNLLLRAGGWTVRDIWTDEKNWFSLILAEAKPFLSAP